MDIGHSVAIPYSADCRYKLKMSFLVKFNLASKLNH